MVTRISYYVRQQQAWESPGTKYQQLGGRRVARVEGFEAAGLEFKFRYLFLLHGTGKEARTGRKVTDSTSAGGKGKTATTEKNGRGWEESGERRQKG